MLQSHIITPSSRRASDRFVKPAIPPTIVSPGGSSSANIIQANTSGGCPMDIAKI